MCIRDRYYLFAKADAQENESETDETNNHQSLGQHTVSCSPDLVISQDNLQVTGQQLSGSIEVTNQGLSSSSATDVSFYLSTDAVIDAMDTPIGTHPLSSLASNGAQTITVDLSMCSTLPQGSYTLGTIVDPQDAVNETNENNNSLVNGQHTVDCRADLHIGANNLQVTANQLSGSITVENAGLTASSITCLLYTSPSPRDATLSRMPSSA